MRRCGVMLGVLLSLLALEAHAQVEASVGAEYFDWSEKISPLEVSERGPLLAVALGLTQPKDRGLRVAYRGRYRIGAGDYQGAFLFAPSVPASTTTRFATMTQEAQLRYGSASGVEAVGSLEFGWWRRQLGTRQTEDYRAVCVLLGIEHGRSGPRGWRGGGGVRIPLTIREDAHFDELGFDQNPELAPGRSTSLFGQLGYRFAPRWACMGSLDSHLLRKSNVVSLTSRGTPQGTSFQPATSLVMLGLRLEREW